MNKRNSILVLSGLGICDDSYQTEGEKCYIDDVDILNLILNLKEEINNNRIGKIEYLIIVGNLTSNGKKKEFDEVINILKQFEEEEGLNIERNNILIVPGDSDINQAEFIHSLDEKGYSDKKPSEVMDLKLKSFKDFYDKFYNNENTYDPNRIINGRITINGVDFIGINTLWGSSKNNKEAEGEISIIKLREELKTAINGINGIAVMYHGLKNTKDTSLQKNREGLKKVFQDIELCVFLAANSETPGAECDTTANASYYIDISPLSSQNGHLLVLDFDGAERHTQEVNQVEFKLHFYEHNWKKDGKNHWQEQTSGDYIKSIVVKPRKGIKALKDVADTIGNEELELKPKKVEKTTIGSDLEGNSFKFDDDESVRKYLIQAIKENNLLMSGHFHWSSAGRSLSFLKTDFLFEKYEYVERIKKIFLRMIEINKLIDDQNLSNQLIIGYAMPGCIIGLPIAIGKKCSFSYIPAIGKDHSQAENIPESGVFTTVTVLIDLVYKEYIVNWLIEQIKTLYGEHPQKINIVTLINAGGNEFPVQELSNHYNIEITFNAALDFQLVDCPYKIKEECLIYTNKLSSVHLLAKEEGNENSRALHRVSRKTDRNGNTSKA